VQFSKTPRPSARPIVVLDFDGTVCLGDGPALAYAEAAFAALPADEGARAHRDLAAWMNGTGTGDHADSYGAIHALAQGITPDQRREAYQASRRRLVHDDLGVTTPDGLAQLLDDLAEHDVERVLLTNSPAVGLGETLERLDLIGRFDQVVVEGHKGSRMRAHLTTLLGDQDPRRLVSVGDHWKNDVGPAVEIGAVGMLITGSWGARDQNTYPGAISASALADLIPLLR
jgi:FMN phosphatase YigB (HAD superfamily)